MRWPSSTPRPWPSPALSFPLPREALGFIPTDWYPSALAVHGDDLLIATAKGEGAGPNSGISQLKNERRHREHPYIPTLIYGSLSRLNFRNVEKHLPELTQRVQESNLFLSDPGKITFRSGSNPIHHVIYILKENRTYDQILGDLKLDGRKVGNGDPSLTMYGAEITPNQHKLALQFGVLDNFYDSGEVSGDGHDWSNAAITSDYNEKTWQISYRGKERTYDFGGTVADEFPLELGEPDVDAPGTGYLWDNLARHGLTYRDYGEYIAGVWCKAAKQSDASPKEGTPSPFSSECERAVVRKGEPLPPDVGQPHGSASPWPWAVPLLKRMKASKAALRDHFHPGFPDFNTEYPDQLRADLFLNEFEDFVRARKEGKDAELPAFVLLYLPDDHTHGTTPGKPSPSASVADNDLAVGRVVEAVSHSPYWDDTAIFIIEDDAQDGADHVDAHRSIALEISKYSPGSAQQPFIDSRFYTTVNMMHTMETLLGLPPMNQNDAYAPVMAPLFTGAGDQPPFTADSSNRDNGLIYQTNAAKGQGAAESAKMDFTRPDAVNTAVLNLILWRDRMGAVPMPAPKHSVFPQKRVCRQGLSPPILGDLLRGCRSRFYVGERKRQRHIGIFLAANLHVGIDEIIQRRSILRRAEAQVASHGELHPVGVVGSEEIVPLLLVLPRLRDVYRNPTMRRLEEIGPAVIAGDLGGVLVRRQGKSNFKARGNSLGARHGDEQRMKIGTVAFLGIAGIEHVAVPPARAGLVVAHGSKDVVVDGPGLVERRGLALGDFYRELGGKAGDRDQFVRL